MKKETKNTIIAVVKEGIARPAIESAYAWVDAWDKLLFGPRASYRKTNNPWHPGVTRIKPVIDYKSEMFKKMRTPKPVETPTRKIDADKLLEKIREAQDEVEHNSDDWLSGSYGDDVVAQHALDDAYWKVEDWVNDLLKED